MPSLPFNDLSVDRTGQSSSCRIAPQNDPRPRCPLSGYPANTRPPQDAVALSRDSITCLSSNLQSKLDRRLFAPCLQRVQPQPEQPNPLGHREEGFEQRLP